MTRAVLLLLFASAAWAQNKELWFVGGVSIFTNNGLGSPLTNGKENDVTFEGGTTLGARITYNTAGIAGHEAQYIHTRSGLESNLPNFPTPENHWGVHTLGYNILLYSSPTTARLRPFLTVGAHYSIFVPPNESGKVENIFGLNYGGGLKYRFSPRWSARLDIRQYAAPKPLELEPKSGWMLQNEFSAGVGWVF
jgi:opacity protein-like surface antigen